MTKSYVDPLKAMTRVIQRDFIRRSVGYKLRKPQKVRVVCFAGAEQKGEEALEVKEVYDPLNIPRGNITVLENRVEPWTLLREADLGVVMTPRPMTDIKFYKSLVASGRKPKYDIISMDSTSPLGEERIYALCYIIGNGLLANDGILITNFVAGRENEDTQEILGTLHLVGEASTLLGQVLTQKKGAELQKYRANISQVRALAAEVLREKPDFDLQRDRGDIIQRGIYNALFQGNGTLSFKWVRELMDVDAFIQHLVELSEQNEAGLSEEDVRARNGMKELLANKHCGNLEEACAFDVNTAGVVGDRFTEIMARAGMDDHEIGLYRMLLKRPYFIDAAESYTYVSNSGTRMMLDMVKTDRHFTQLERYTSMFITRDGIVQVAPPNFLERDYRAARRLAEELAKQTCKYLYGIPRVDLDTAASSQLEEPVFGEAKPTTAEPDIVLSEKAREYNPPGEVGKQEIYQAISDGISGDDIKRKYGLTTRQLGAFKAHVTMRKGTRNPTLSGNGFDPDDRKAIILAAPNQRP